MDEPLANTTCTPGTPEVGRWSNRGMNPPKIRDRIPGFHTDFTQNDRLGPHTLRHPGQTTNAPMPIKSQKAAHSAGLLADPPFFGHGWNHLPVLSARPAPYRHGEGGMRTFAAGLGLNAVASFASKSTIRGAQLGMAGGNPTLSAVFVSTNTLQVFLRIHEGILRGIPWKLRIFRSGF